MGKYTYILLIFFSSFAYGQTEVIGSTIDRNSIDSIVGVLARNSNDAGKAGFMLIVDDDTIRIYADTFGFQITGDSLRFGTDSSLISFFGVTPVDRPATVADPTGDTTSLKSSISAIIDRLQELGLIE